MHSAPDSEMCKERKERAGPYRLSIEAISTFYGEAQALKDVSIVVYPKEVVTILGSNGAGKTTLLKTLIGLLSPRFGKIFFEETSIESRPSHEIITKGIASVPEGRELFGSLNVMDNLLLGTYSLPEKKRKQILVSRLDMIFTLFPILKERLKQKAETLSGGQQQMLAVARGLMAKPKLLLLDEPTLGLSPVVTDEVLESIANIHEHGVTVLIVEQNVARALAVAARAYVFETGRVVAQGTAKDLLGKAELLKAYLGG